MKSKAFLTLFVLLWVGSAACNKAVAQNIEIDLSSEGLQEFPLNSIDSGLVSIDLRKNEIIYWPEALSGLPQLRELRLSRNPLQWPDTLIGFSALRYLDLWDTDISRVPSFVVGFDNLEELDLRETYLDERNRAALEAVFPGVEIHLTERCICRPKP